MFAKADTGTESNEPTFGAHPIIPTHDAKTCTNLRAETLGARRHKRTLITVCG